MLTVEKTGENYALQPGILSNGVPVVCSSDLKT